MTIQEAIEHCREEAAKNRTRAVEHANAYDRDNAEACHECAQEHEQLAMWLIELIELQERRTTHPARRAHWIGVEVEGESGTGPIYSKVACSGCGFENDHEPAYCECCGARMDAEEENGV